MLKFSKANSHSVLSLPKFRYPVNFYSYVKYILPEIIQCFKTVIKGLGHSCQKIKCDQVRPLFNSGGFPFHWESIPSGVSNPVFKRSYYKSSDLVYTVKLCSRDPNFQKGDSAGEFISMSPPTTKKKKMQFCLSFLPQEHLIITF